MWPLSRSVVRPQSEPTSNCDTEMRVPSVHLPLSFHLCVYSFTLFIYCLPMPLDPLFSIADTVDSNEGVLVCEPQLAVTLKFFLRQTPGCVAIRLDSDRQYFQGDVKCEAAKMVDAVHARGLLKSSIIPRNIFQADCIGDLIKRLAEKMLLVVRDHPADLGVPFLVVVCRPRQWELQIPGSDPSPGNDEQKSENKQLWSAESEPPAIGFRFSGFGINRGHVIFLADTSE